MTTTIEFITALFYEVDEQLRAIPKHPEARLWPSEVVTLGLLAAREPARLRVPRCRRGKSHRAHPCAGVPPNPGLPRARCAGSAYLEHSIMLENDVCLIDLGSLSVSSFL